MAIRPFILAVYDRAVVSCNGVHVLRPLEATLDLEAVYADLAAKQNKPVEEIKKDFNEHYASYIKNEALNKKLMAYLKDNNTIK